MVIHLAIKEDLMCLDTQLSLLKLSISAVHAGNKLLFIQSFKE